MDCPQHIERQAPAKVNLALAVPRRRVDGFHEIRSWVVSVDWYDRLIFRPASEWRLEVESREPAVTAGPSNLVTRAAEALSRSAGCPVTGDVRLIKEIPSGAGLGGGSSDAAQTLLGLNELWQLKWPLERLCVVAESIGSDVPYFLHDRPMLMEGRGERLSPLSIPWHGWFVIVDPPFALATQDVYRRHSQIIGSQTLPEDRLPRQVPSDASTSRALTAMLFNDLEPAAFELSPELKALHSSLSGLSSHIVRMTGSGSALFVLFDSMDEAGAWVHEAHTVAPHRTTFKIARRR